MGNRTAACSCNAQRCADELGFPQPDDRLSRDPDCDPGGTIFNETLEGLSFLDQEALRFAGTANLSAVRWLLVMGADVGVHDSKGTTMLHAACRSGSSAVVQELVRRKAPLDVVDSAGWTPLHVAAVMGRRPLVVLLLRHGASPDIKNNRGATPVLLCTDPGTREVFKGGDLSPLADLLDSQGGVRGDASDRTTCCVPFFVPRQPLFLDCGHSAELLSLCSEMLDQSVGHGLAFCVAAGIVKDRPTDLSHFLLEQRTNPKRLGDFLGEELSMSETLRLAFMDSMDLFNTGVVSGLCRAFRHIHAPQNFGKIDRLTTAVAHMWWRAHDGLDEVYEDEAFLGGQSQHPPPDGVEISGMHLRRHMRSVEGLQRLMFSAVMLYWALHGSSLAFPMPAISKKDHLSVRGWLDINSGIEFDGADVPECVLERIYRALSEQVSTNLLPSFDHCVSPRSIQKEDQSVQGWAFIPPGGLERHEAPLPMGGGSTSTPHLAQCILSETSPTPILTPRTMAVDAGAVAAASSIDAGAEAVWLSLRYSLILFLATSPADNAPYAFVRLTDAVLRDVDQQSRQLVLAGRPRKASAGICKEGAELEGEFLQTPFGDIARHPLELCFLLRDGRFQSFATLWLELRFNTDEELELWLRELGSACREPESRRTLQAGVDAVSGSRPRLPPPVSPITKPRTPRPSPSPQPHLPRTLRPSPSPQPHLPRLDHSPAPVPPSMRGRSGDGMGDQKAEMTSIPEHSQLVGRSQRAELVDEASSPKAYSDIIAGVHIVTNFV